MSKRERISPVDTAWLRMDRPTNLMMIVGVMIFAGPMDYARLRRTLENLDRRGVRFLLSYLDCEEVQPLRSRFAQRTIPVARTVSGLVATRQVVSEVLVRNY